MVLDVVNRVLNGRDLLGLLIGNLGLEFVFERHHQLYGVKRIGSQIIDELRLCLDLGFVDTQLFSHNLFNALFDVFHSDS
jgi:hypothetical protein